MSDHEATTKQNNIDSVELLTTHPEKLDSTSLDLDLSER